MVPVTLKLGKNVATRSKKLVRFRDFLDTSALPALPSGDFGHDSLIRSGSWGMLGNNNYGDCVWAGADHEHMLWLAESGIADPTKSFTDTTALADYASATGFNPNDPNTDQGTDMEAAASYRRKTGVVDTSGKRHTIGAYVDVDPGNITELWYAAWLFDGVGIGVNFPSAWMDAFNKGPNGLWDKVSNPNIEGGHYISGVARTGGKVNIVTWADDHPRLTVAGYGQFNDQTLAYASPEKLHSGVDTNGYDWPGLLNLLQKLTGGNVPVPVPVPPVPTPPVPVPPITDFPVVPVEAWLTHKHTHTKVEATAASAITTWGRIHGIPL